MKVHNPRATFRLFHAAAQQPFISISACPCLRVCLLMVLNVVICSAAINVSIMLINPDLMPLRGLQRIMPEE